jgi:hypothetical protein
MTAALVWKLILAWVAVVKTGITGQSPGRSGQSRLPDGLGGGTGQHGGAPVGRGPVHLAPTAHGSSADRRCTGPRAGPEPASTRRCWPGTARSSGVGGGVPGTCSTAPVWPISACAGVPGAAIGETISAPLCLLKSDYLPGPEQDTAMRAFCRRRLQIETTFSTLDATFHLKCPRARTYWDCSLDWRLKSPPTTSRWPPTASLGTSASLFSIHSPDTASAILKGAERFSG